jgi:hypothetical protein
MTFSVPLTMKYPPGSSAHSFICAICLSVLPASRHFELRSMMGILPMRQFCLLIMDLPRTYLMSTLIGAAYVMSRNRHSFGVISFCGLRSSKSSRSGSPTRISRYLRTPSQERSERRYTGKLTRDKSDCLRHSSPSYLPPRSFLFHDRQRS